MTSPRPRLFDFSPLAHPIWWAALAVLLVNDNLLKGHGIVPGWLTGKLSDFAFLIVAPVLLAALLPLALPGRRAAALIAVVALYTAADLSHGVSDGVVAVAARFGLIWKLWPDLTDLIALIVLPVSIRLLYGTDGRTNGWFRLARERAGVVVGALACIATSDDSVYDPSFLFNATAGAETIRVTWVLSKHYGYNSSDPCDEAETVAATLNPNDLDDPVELRLERGQVAILTGPRSPGEASPVGTCTPGPYGDTYTCVAAIMEAPGATPVLMIAPLRGRVNRPSSSGPGCGGDDPPLKRCAPMLNPAIDAGPGALTLSDKGGQRRFVAGERIKMVPIDPAAIAARAPAPEGCRALREEYRALMASTACVSDTDCNVRSRQATLDDSSPCGFYVNASAAQQVDDIATAWRAECLVFGYRSCVPQPPACNNGVCGETCPGVVVPPCEYACPTDRAPAEYCYSGFKCDSGGSLCTCTNQTLSCVLRQPAAPGCRLSCTPP
jgi:hypothetical protein